MRQFLQYGHLTTIPHEHQRNILTTTFMDEFMYHMNCVFNTILFLHHTNVSKEIRPSPLQLRLGSNQSYASQVWPITYNKYLIFWAFVTFNKYMLLRCICHNNQVCGSTRTPFQKALKFMNKSHFIHKLHFKDLWSQIM